MGLSRSARSAWAALPAPSMAARHSLHPARRTADMYWPEKSLREMHMVDVWVRARYLLWIVAFAFCGHMANRVSCISHFEHGGGYASDMTDWLAVSGLPVS